MAPVSVVMSQQMDETVRAHLFQSRVEQVAFLLGRFAEGEFLIDDLLRIPRKGFDHQSALHVSLSDDERARVIKWAWDKQGSLVETHVHLFNEPAAFSASDIGGLRDFVPPNWWRLRKRPYGALVFGPSSFDGLAWVTDAETPEQIGTIRIDGGGLKQATGRSLDKWNRAELLGA
jgi:hypothetical protein